MKKRLFALFLAMVLCLSFASCSSSAEEDTTETETTEVTEATSLDDVLPAEIVDYGYTVYENGDYVCVNYALEYTNPNEGITMTEVPIVITSKDADGNVIDEQEDVAGDIAGLDTAKFANVLEYEGDVPATVEITTYKPEIDYSYDEESICPMQSQFDITDTDIFTEDGEIKVSGTVTNNTTSFTGSFLIVVVLYNDGEIVGGGLGSSTPLSLFQEASMQFEFSDGLMEENFEYDDYTVSLML